MLPQGNSSPGLGSKPENSSGFENSRDQNRSANDAAEERSASEQLEDFENELKETDWGHQPC
jgi:hypothetical protein